jgi:hypothetical protein
MVTRTRFPWNDKGEVENFEEKELERQEAPWPKRVRIPLANVQA